MSENQTNDTSFEFGKREPEVSGPCPWMTLRDYFAAKAMQAGLGLLQSPDCLSAIADRSEKEGVGVEVILVRDAYGIADVMLAERTK